MEDGEQILKENKIHTKRSLGEFVFAFFVAVPAFMFWCFFFLVFIISVALFSDDGGDEEEVCTVARISVQGVLTATGGFGFLSDFASIASADSIISEIQEAEKDENIEAIVLDIDSPGGTPVAADEIFTELKKITKPTVAVVRDLGTSAAYWVAVGTDHIIASPVSEVGSIGVTMSYLEYASSTESEGSRWIDLSSGLFKDAGHPERKLREEEEEYFQSQVDEVHAYMIERIASARHGISEEELFALADGRAFLGSDALSKKLIDELGSFDEASAYVAQTLSKERDDVVLCSASGKGWLMDLLR